MNDYQFTLLYGVVCGAAGFGVGIWTGIGARRRKDEELDEVPKVRSRVGEAGSGEESGAVSEV